MASHKVHVTLGGFTMEGTPGRHEPGEGMDNLGLDTGTEDTVRSLAELLEHESALAEEDVTPMKSNGLVIRTSSAHDDDDEIEEEARRMGVDAGEIGMLSRMPSKLSKRSISQRTISQVSTIKLNPKEYPLKISVAALFATMVAGVCLIFHFNNIQLYLLKIGATIKFNEITRHMDVEAPGGELLMRGDLGLKIPEEVKFLECSDDDTRKSHLCLTWKGHAQMFIDFTSHHDNNVRCFKIAWWGHQHDTILQDCYDTGGAHWFGGGALTQDQQWVIDNVSFPETLYVTGNFEDPSHFGPVLARYWVNSNGIAIFAPTDYPVFVSFNEIEEDKDGVEKKNGKLCLVSHNLDEFGLLRVKQKPRMNYTLCVSEDIGAVHMFALKESLSRDSNKTSAQLPEENLLKRTVWSTTANQPSEFTQASLIGYSTEITANDYSPGYFILNSQWEEFYGDLTFNREVFHAVDDLLYEIKSNFTLALALTPLVDTRSANFQRAVENNLFVPDLGGKVPGLVWYPGSANYTVADNSSIIGGVLNTDSAYFADRLTEMKNRLGVESVLLKSGTVKGLPHGADFGATSTSNVNGYTEAYVTKAKHIFPVIFAESASQTQFSMPVIAMPSLPSTWEGLQSVVPKILTLGLLGYPLVLPEVIGGSLNASRASKDLYIRWLQLSAFLPIMHFSIPPHSYDTTTADLARKFIHFHSKEIAPRVMRSLQQSATRIESVVRPLWWIAPKDNHTFTIDDQFLIGDNMIVAPMLRDAQKRDIYLPEGYWVDAASNHSYMGPQWLRNYEVKIDQVPYFLWQSQ